jgi:uncharacterized protein DUF6624
MQPNEIESVKNSLRKIQMSDQATREKIAEKSKNYKPNSAEIKSLWLIQKKIDAENQKIVSDILSRYGWPNRKEYGSIGPAQVVFLVIQHAPLAYQKQYYEIVKQAVESGSLMKNSFALFEDRLLVRQGKKQRYGSQVKVDQTSGAQEFYPIEDELNVDKRRKAMGLQPIAEYAKLFAIDYRLKKSADVEQY